MTTDADAPLPPAPAGERDQPPAGNGMSRSPTSDRRWPLTGSLSYLITVSALAAFEVIAWPIAGLLGLGHLMARDRDNRVVSEIGSGLKVVG